MTNSQRDLSIAVADTVAGFSAGLVSTLVVHPLDVIKTRLQVDRHSSSKLGSSIRVLREIARESIANKNFWVQGYYRGLSPNLVGNTASWSLYFLWYGQIKQWIESARNDGTLNSADYLVSSAAAGVATSALTNPVWVVKTRMMSSDSGVAGAYRGLIDGLTQIVAKEGLRGLYRGFLPSLFGVSQAAVQFMTYEKLKLWRKTRRQQQAPELEISREEAFKPLLHKGLSNPSSSSVIDLQAPIHDGHINPKQENVAVSKFNGDGRIRKNVSENVVAAEPSIPSSPPSSTPPLLTNLDFIFLSALSKIVSGALTYPYQVVRARLQTYDAETLYSSARNVMMQTYKAQGLAGFYRGLAPNLVRVLPSTCITFLVYENTRSHLQRQPDLKSS